MKEYGSNQKKAVKSLLDGYKSDCTGTDLLDNRFSSGGRAKVHPTKPKASKRRTMPTPQTVPMGNDNDADDAPPPMNQNPTQPMMPPGAGPGAMPASGMKNGGKAGKPSLIKEAAARAGKYKSGGVTEKEFDSYKKADVKADAKAIKSAVSKEEKADKKADSKSRYSTGGFASGGDPVQAAAAQADQISRRRMAQPSPAPMGPPPGGLNQDPYANQAQAAMQQAQPPVPYQNPAARPMPQQMPPPPMPPGAPQGGGGVPGGNQPNPQMIAALLAQLKGGQSQPQQAPDPNAAAIAAMAMGGRAKKVEGRSKEKVITGKPPKGKDLDNNEASYKRGGKASDIRGHRQEEADDGEKVDTDQFKDGGTAEGRHPMIVIAIGHKKSK